jgi:hypothetical protein
MTKKHRLYMRKCRSCQRSTFDAAKFCHHCGAKMEQETQDCPDCNHINPVDARACEKCNFDFFAPVPTTIPQNKKRSIFDDILEEKAPILENEEDLNDILDDDLEDKLELVFERPELENFAEEKKEENDAGINIDTTITEEKDEEIEEKFDFSFENTLAETTDSILTKVNIPFEIVELPIIEPADIEPEIIKDAPLESPFIEDVEIVKETLNESFIEEEEIETFDLENPQPTNDLFEENPNDNIEEELFQKFADAFEKQVKTEQNPAKYNTYVDRFETSDFKLSFEIRIKQLAEEIQKIRQDKSNLLKDENALLEHTFTELTADCIVLYCQDLNDVPLSENILQYQNITPENIDLSAMILDYLDFENESERIDFDFIKMPVKRLQNASKNFLFPAKGEKIFFICDQTILGSAKEGFAMTEKAIYWKMQFETAQRVYYKNLQTIEQQKDWITINDMFFNANPSLNVKLLKLLEKLKTI